MKLLTLIAIFAGEAFYIWGEVIMGHTQRFQFRSAFLLFFGAACLGWGYLYGTKYWGDIWFVGVVSMTAIIVVEPCLVYYYFRTIPEPRVLLGMVLGVLGLLVSI